MSCPDGPPTRLKIPESSPSLLDIRFQDVFGIPVFLMPQHEVLLESFCKIADISMKDPLRKAVVKDPEKFVFAVELAAVDQAGFDEKVFTGHVQALVDRSRTATDL